MASGLPQTGVELVAANLQGFVGSLNKGEAAVQGFSGNMERQAGQTSKTSEIMIGALRKVGEIAVNVMLKAGQAVIGFGQDSLRLAGDFDQGMQQFKVAAGNGLDTQGIQEFHDLFLQLGKDLPVSTSEVQTAATEMVKGGLDPAILAAGGLKQNIQFAAAAMSGDLVGAATISAKIVAGWSDVNATASDKANLLAHATDLLTKAANASSVDVQELSLGLFNVQATAKNAGISLDDVTTVLAELSGDFASSSEAGNSLASFITRLHPTTKAATQAMESLGLVTEDGGNAFYDAQGNFVGFQKASEILKESLKGLNNEQRQQIMQTIFQKDAMGVAAGLASRGADGYDAMASSLQNAMGVAAAGATVQEGYNTAVENAQGGLEALKITLGEKLLPFMTDFYNFLNEKVLTVLIDLAGAIFGDQAAFDKLSPTLQSVVTNVGVLVSDVQEIIGAFIESGASTDEFRTRIGDLATDLALPREPIEAIVGAIQELSTHGQGLVDTFNEWLPTIEAVGVALGTFTILSTVVGWITGAVAAVTSFGAAVATAGGPIAALVAVLGGPVTIVLGAVALAVGALYLAWTNNWGDIQGKTAAAWAVIQPIFDDVVSWLQTEIPAAVQTASTFWTETLWPALQKVGDFISTNIFPILDDLANTFLAVAGVEVKALADLWTNILWPALKVVGAFIGDVLWPIFQKLFEIEFAIAMKVGEALAGLWQKVLWPALQKVGEYISGTIIPTFQKIGDYLEATFGPTLKSISDWLTKVTGGFTGVSSAVSKVTDFLGTLANKISTLKLPSWLTPGSPTPWEIALYGIGDALTSSVVPGLSEMASAVSGVGDQVREQFVSSDFPGMLDDLGHDMMAGFGKGIKSATKGILNLINSTADTVEGAFKDAFQTHSPSERMVPIGEWIIGGLMQGMSNLLPSLTEQVAGMSDDLVTQVQDITQSVASIVGGAFGATATIDRQIASNIDKLKEVLPEYRDATDQLLSTAEQEASKFQDPEQGSKYYAMRSKQIFEMANLQRDLAEAQQEAKDADAEGKQEGLTPEDRNDAAQRKLAAMQEAERIQRRMGLIDTAQQAELGQFNAQQVAATNPLQDLVQLIGSIFNNSTLDDLDTQLANAKNDEERARIQNEIDQHRLPNDDTGVGSSLMQVLSSIERLLSQARYSPPATAGQYAQNGGGTTTTSNTNYNMPVYTNNSLQALQQSLALLMALSQ